MIAGTRARAGLVGALAAVAVAVSAVGPDAAAQQGHPSFPPLPRGEPRSLDEEMNMLVGGEHPAHPKQHFGEVGTSDQPSPMPTAAEWKDAPEVEPTRRGPRAQRCHVWRVREWVRVSCPDLVTSSIAMLGGTAQGMAFWIDPVREGTDGKLPAGGEVLFPVRRGDRRVVQFLSFGAGYEGPFTQRPALVVQQSWLPDEEKPVLLLH